MKKSRITITVIALAVIAIAAFSIYFSNNSDKTAEQAIPAKINENGDIVIPVAEISDKASFFAYNELESEMEIIAVKASDGTIRTAFNTCQVCYSSGRGYYVQEGNELVCQNCGNRFNMDQVEVVKGGCNPVPIFEEQKIDNGDSIVITKEFLEEAEIIFENWKV